MTFLPGWTGYSVCHHVTFQASAFQCGDFSVESKDGSGFPPRTQGLYWMWVGSRPPIVSAWARMLFCSTSGRCFFLLAVLKVRPRIAMSHKWQGSSCGVSRL